MSRHLLLLMFWNDKVSERKENKLFQNGPEYVTNIAKIKGGNIILCRGGNDSLWHGCDCPHQHIAYSTIGCSMFEFVM